MVVPDYRMVSFHFSKNDIEDFDTIGFPAAENSENGTEPKHEGLLFPLVVEMCADATMCTIDDCIADFHQLERKAE